jgi:hypothetical protein
MLEDQRPRLKINVRRNRNEAVATAWFETIS